MGRCVSEKGVDSHLLSNHDNARLVSRFGDDSDELERYPPNFGTLS
jgi:glycosidase